MAYTASEVGGQPVLGGPAHDEAMQGRQRHPAPGDQIVMQGGSCPARRPAPTPGRALLGGLWPGVWSASATAHTSATRRPNAAVPLYLSPKSLERHVAAVFDKLGLPPDSDTTAGSWLS
jgi:hypothetical protein